MTDDPARKRLMAMHAIRWSGVALVIVGIFAITRRIDLPIEAGYAILVVGLIDALVMPVVLARRWKSPPP